MLPTLKQNSTVGLLTQNLRTEIQFAWAGNNEKTHQNHQDKVMRDGTPDLEQRRVF